MLVCVYLSICMDMVWLVRLHHLQSTIIFNPPELVITPEYIFPTGMMYINNHYRRVVKARVLIVTVVVVVAVVVVVVAVVVETTEIMMHYIWI